MAPKNHIYLSDSEMEELKLLAELEGKDIDEAASESAQKEIGRRFTRNTGKPPAPAIDIKRKKP